MDKVLFKKKYNNPWVKRDYSLIVKTQLIGIASNAIGVFGVFACYLSQYFDNR